MKTEIRQQIADKLRAMLETHGTNWTRPWTSKGQQRNAETNRPYRGANAFLTLAAGYDSPYWHTYKGWARMGHQVAKGSSGLPVLFWKRSEIEREDGSKRAVMWARGYTVFNAEQLTGAFHKPAGETFEHNPHQTAESVIKATGATIDYRDADEAYYVPSMDSIMVPPLANFKTADAFYSTVFHELGHWTGHESRLDRKLANGFGSPEYAFEELIAETCSAFLCVETGVTSEPRPDHARYINNWIKACEDKPDLVTRAFSQAQKAADFIIGEDQAQQVAA